MPTDSSGGDSELFTHALASRLRHDLKGGLISLRLGLEALPDQEDLKRPLIDGALRVERLADKLIALIRVGALKRDRVGIPAFVSELAQRLEAHYPQLELRGFESEQTQRLWIDVEAFWLALREVAENSLAAGARSFEILVRATSEGCVFEFADDGHGLLEDGGSCQQSGSEGGLSVTPGLGLEVARRCAQSHGGSMTLSNRGAPQSGVVVTLAVTHPSLSPNLGNR